MIRLQAKNPLLTTLGLIGMLALGGCAGGQAGNSFFSNEGATPTAKLADMAMKQPQNGELQLAYGKALARDGQTDAAIQVLSSPAALATRDLSLYATLGSLYDQKGDYKTARGLYGQGFAINRHDAALLNNYAMSFILEGNPAQAESILRAAMAGGKAKDPRIRQNLALAVGLQGRFQEARQIASADLPPADVEANLNYLEKMLQGQDTWQQLRSSS